MQGVGGAVHLPKGFLKAAYELIRERGGVCIADEVLHLFKLICQFYKKLTSFCFVIIRFKLDLVVLVPTIGVLKLKVLLQISVCKINRPFAS